MDLVSNSPWENIRRGRLGLRTSMDSMIHTALEVEEVMMSAQSLECLEARLRRVEQSSRRWRRVSLAVLAVLGVLGFAGAQERGGIKRIEATEIVILDKGGKPRVTLGVTQHGPLLTFSPDNGPPRLLMGLGGGPFRSDAPFLNLRDKDGMPRFNLGVSSEPDGHESAYFNVSDKGGLAKLRFRVEPDGTIHLDFSDPAHKPRLSLGVDARDGPFIVLQDPKGDSVFTAPVSPPQAGAKKGNIPIGP